MGTRPEAESENMNYYNEIDPSAVAWLRELIGAGLIPDGRIDTRSISEVQPQDLYGYDQCHFFAGIAGWPLALRLAEWTGPVWTGSCPCQPFSSAGRQRGTADERHLWPDFFRLIAECRPPTVFGEQVASKLGRGWLAGVRADLEGVGYAVGAADLCAAGVGAPHIRQRLYWVADSKSERRDRSATLLRENWRAIPETDCRLDNSAGPRQPSSGCGKPGESERGWGLSGVGRPDGGLGHTLQPGLEGHARHESDRGEPGRLHSDPAGSTGAPSRPWSRYDLLPFRDGKTRRVEPGTFPLAHGIPGRVGLLRGYGNAIVPQVAEAFIRAFVDVR